MNSHDPDMADDNKNNDHHGAVDGEQSSHLPQQQQQGNGPLHYLHISKERLRQSIAKWEELLKCSKCQTLQESLDNLFQHPSYQRPICIVCKEKNEDQSSNNNHSASDQTSSQVIYPISYLIGCGVPKKKIKTSQSHSNKEEAARGPAIMLKQMILLLQKVEEQQQQEQNRRHKNSTKNNNRKIRQIQ